MKEQSVELVFELLADLLGLSLEAACSIDCMTSEPRKSESIFLKVTPANRDQEAILSLMAQADPARGHPGTYGLPF